MSFEQRDPQNDDVASSAEPPLKPWQAPTVRRFPAAGAEFGSLNGADGDAKS